MEKMMELGNLLFGNSRGQYPIERHPMQEIFWEYFEDAFDYHCFVEGYDSNERGGYENDIFLINPYYWGDDEDIAAEPNFVYKPEGIEIQWYKYALRDAYCNIELTKEKAREIFEKCRRSMDEQR